MERIEPPYIRVCDICHITSILWKDSSKVVDCVFCRGKACSHRSKTQEWLEDVIELHGVVCKKCGRYFNYFSIKCPECGCSGSWGYVPKQATQPRWLEPPKTNFGPRK